MKNKIILILIILLTIILGGMLYFYITSSNTSSNIQTGFSQLGDFQQRVDTSNWTYEEYTFVEEINDNLSNNNEATINLTQQSIEGSGAKFSSNILYITSGGEYNLSRRIGRLYSN